MNCVIRYIPKEPLKISGFLPSLNPSNWGVVKDSKEFINSINQFNSNVKAIFNDIGNVIYVITHPIIIWHWFVGISYWVCLIIGVGGLLLYICYGKKKCARWAAGSVIAYTLIQAINSGL